MQYDARNPEHYIQMLAEDWRREKLLEIRTLIKDISPDLIEGINYKMLSYSTKKGIVFHLNAQKNYVSLYVGSVQTIDPTGTMLNGLDVGKSCIRIKKLVNLANTELKSFIEQAVKLADEGKMTGC